MPNPQIAAIREQIASRPRPTEIAEMRAGIDARGLANKLPADVTVQKVTANGVPAEWTSTPAAAKDAVILYLHGGGYVIGSPDSPRPPGAEIGSGPRAGAMAGGVGGTR